MNNDKWLNGMKNPFLKTFVFSCVLSFPLSLASMPILAQQVINYDAKDIPPPKAETFSATTDLLAPWRSSRCALKASEILNHLCVDYVGDEYVNASVVTLYNSDGTIWHKLELNVGAPGYFLDAGIKDFIPFSTSVPSYPHSIILRMAGESPNWYEVEINEDTKTTKYARRGDKAWSKTRWDGWLYKSVNLYLGQDQPPLRDAPNGKIIAASELIKFERVQFLKAEGDWAYVEGLANPRIPKPEFHRGWLRWRNGRNILVGCIFNSFKVPDVSK
jgi:hypothetical protein